MKDLADSERDYCSQLWSLLHTYLTPLQTAGFLSARELGVVFPSCLDHLYAEHCLICTGLQDKLVHWTYMGTVADLLARITDSQNSVSISFFFFLNQPCKYIFCLNICRKMTNVQWSGRGKCSSYVSNYKLTMKTLWSIIGLTWFVVYYFEISWLHWLSRVQPNFELLCILTSQENILATY